MQSYIRPLSEGVIDLRALMKSALPLLNKASASKTMSQGRVWGSRSDLSCHQLDHTSHRAVGFLTILNAKPPALLEESQCFTYAEDLPEWLDCSKYYEEALP
jgi:hypothetical protein